jgi:hypothetical protein
MPNVSTLMAVMIVSVTVDTMEMDTVVNRPMLMNAQMDHTTVTVTPHVLTLSAVTLVPVAVATLEMDTTARRSMSMNAQTASITVHQMLIVLIRTMDSVVGATTVMKAMVLHVQHLTHVTQAHVPMVLHVPLAHMVDTLVVVLVAILAAVKVTVVAAMSMNVTTAPTTVLPVQPV